MNTLKLKSVSELVAGDVFHTGVVHPIAFEVMAIEERETDFKLLLQGPTMSGWQSYPKNEIMRLRAW